MKTIDHDPNERHTKAPPVESYSAKDPIFSGGAFPLLMSIIAGLLLFYLAVKPISQAVCNSFDFCTTAERASRSMNQPADLPRQ